MSYSMYKTFARKYKSVCKENPIPVTKRTGQFKVAYENSKGKNALPNHSINDGFKRKKVRRGIPHADTIPRTDYK